MFEIGDKVICVKTSNYIGISLHETYVVYKIYKTWVFIRLLNDENFIPMCYPSECFINIIQQRKDKINKIKKNICLK